MKVMLTTRFKDSFHVLPPEKLKQIIDAQREYMEKLMNEGKVEDYCYLGNMKGAMVIFDLNSSEEVARIPHEAPIFPFLDTENSPSRMRGLPPLWTSML